MLSAAASAAKDRIRQASSHIPSPVGRNRPFVCAEDEAAHASLMRSGSSPMVRSDAAYSAGGAAGSSPEKQYYVGGAFAHDSPGALLHRGGENA